MTLAEVQDEVIRVCEENYRLADDECGMSLIWNDDITEEATGVFVVRFRLHSEMEGKLNRMVDHFCSTVVPCERILFVQERTEYGIPYLECVWVIDSSR